jgi:hypothetical protein
MSFKLSTLVSGLGETVKGIFTKPFEALETSAKNELETLEGNLVAFAKTDLGKLAIDAVGVASDKLTGDPAFAAASAQFVKDAATAGYDLTKVGSGVVDWFVQSAYTFTAGVFANIPTATK